MISVVLVRLHLNYNCLGLALTIFIACWLLVKSTRYPSRNATAIETFAPSSSMSEPPSPARSIDSDASCPDSAAGSGTAGAGADDGRILVFCRVRPTRSPSGWMKFVPQRGRVNFDVPDSYIESHGGAAIAAGGLQARDKHHVFAFNGLIGMGAK